MFNQLRAVGNNMSDDDFVMCVLAGLGPEYDSIVTNINSMPESPSLSEVHGMLLSQENRIEQNLSSGVVEANYTQMRNGRRNWGNNDRTGNQYQPGIIFRHPSSGNRNNQGNQNPQDKGKGKAIINDDGSESKGPCQICFKMGHTAADCWHGFKKNFVPQSNRRREIRGAYVASTDGQSNGAWYLDSGATNHVTNALGNININSEYQGNDQLAVGNGEKFVIYHIGCSVLSTFDPKKHITLNHMLHVPDITKILLAFPNCCMIMTFMLSFTNLPVLLRTRSKGKF